MEPEMEGRPPAPAPRPEPPPEPVTAAALWPTFMRRTLAEEAVRPH